MESDQYGTPFVEGRLNDETVGDGRFVLKEVAPGFTPREVLELTEMEITVGPDVKMMD